MEDKAQRQSINTENLIRSYGDEVLRVLYLYVKDMDVARDLFQDTFVKVHLKLGEFRNASHIKTWIMTVAINTAKDYLKSAYNKKVTVFSQLEDEEGRQPEIADKKTGVEQAVIKNEECKQVRRALMSMKQEFREVLICVYYLEMSEEETAKSLSIPKGTVKSRLSRAKAELKKKIERMDEGEEY